MSDWKTEIVRIEKIEKHANADRLSIVTVLGDYPVITNMTGLKVGDLIGYLGIDTVCPDTKYFHFLCPMEYEKYEDENGDVQRRQIGPKYPVGSVPEKYRILKAKKIRNVYSMGMLHPLPDGMKEGDSLVELLDLKKWEEEEEDNINPNSLKLKGRNAASPPKGWQIPYYDIDGLRKYINCLNEGEEIVLTEKIHGANFSAVFDGEKLWVKSRKYYKKRDDIDSWWDAAIRYELENKLKDYPMFVVFGELYGNVKGFRYDSLIDGGKLLTKVRFFDVLNLNMGRYLDYDDFVKVIDSLGLERVPELYRGSWLGKDKMYPYAEGASTLNSKHVREGFVLKTIKERFEPRLNSRLIIKLVGEGYNLKK